MATPAPAAGGGTGAGQFKFDAKRWAQTDRIVAGATFILLISLFLPWFTYKYGLGSLSVDGLWHGWMYLTLLLCLAVLAYLVMMAGFATMPFKLPVGHEQALLIATGINFVLCLISFIDKPGGIGFSGIGWGFGAFIGLAASVVAAAPLGWPAIKARRAS